MAQSSNNPGPFLYQEDGRTYASIPAEMMRNIQASPLYEQMQKDCKAEGVQIPETIMAQRSSGPYDDAAGVFDESGRWSDAENDQPRRYGRTGSQERSNATINDGISGRRDPEEKQVSDASLQTDTCDTLYVTKNTLTAYTIAIIQKFAGFAI